MFRALASGDCRIIEVYVADSESEEWVLRRVLIAEQRFVLRPTQFSTRATSVLRGLDRSAGVILLCKG